MKKFATLSLAAAAVFTLSACGGDGAANNATAIDNEIVLNSEDAPLDNLAVETTMDNFAIDNDVVASNTSVVESNTSIDVNSTALNNAE